VLELGCGTGRLSRPLAAIGYDVVGLDNDPEMLGWTAPRVELVEGDMRDFDLKARFPLAIVPYNSLQLLRTVDDQRACFASIARHLLPGGLLGLEVTDFLTDTHTDVFPSEQLATAEGVTLFGSLVTNAHEPVSRYERRYVFDDGTPDVEDVVILRGVNERDLDGLAAGVDLEVVERRHEGRRLSWVARAPAARVGD
jgi:SAM-dependent methyltransferase